MWPNYLDISWGWTSTINVVAGTVIRQLRTLRIHNRRHLRTRPYRTCKRYSRIIGNHRQIKYRYETREYYTIFILSLCCYLYYVSHRQNMKLFSLNRPCTLCLHPERPSLSVRIRETGNIYISNRGFRRIIPSMRKRWRLRAKQIVCFTIYDCFISLSVSLILYN